MFSFSIELQDRLEFLPVVYCINLFLHRARVTFWTHEKMLALYRAQSKVCIPKNWTDVGYFGKLILKPMSIFDKPKIPENDEKNLQCRIFRYSLFHSWNIVHCIEMCGVLFKLNHMRYCIELFRTSLTENIYMLQSHSSFCEYIYQTWPIIRRTGFFTEMSQASQKIAICWHVGEIIP